MLSVLCAVGVCRPVPSTPWTTKVMTTTTTTATFGETPMWLFVLTLAELLCTLIVFGLSSWSYLDKKTLEQFKHR